MSTPVPPADLSKTTEQAQSTDNDKTEMEINQTHCLPNAPDIYTDPDFTTHNPLHNMADPLPRSLSLDF